jgi:hypothetical protein
MAREDFMFKSHFIDTYLLFQGQVVNHDVLARD